MSKRRNVWARSEGVNLKRGWERGAAQARGERGRDREEEGAARLAQVWLFGYFANQPPDTTWMP